MQQRYCDCGYAVWVQYLFPNKNCHIIFKPKRDSREDHLTRCPCCGKKLNIDNLY